MAIATLESVSLAAEQLHLTQPAVTRRLQNLEAQLGQALFDRIGRGLMLTEAGQCLLPYARQILGLMDVTRQALDDLSDPVRGTLKLVTSHHIGLHRLPTVLREFRQQYAQVKLNIRFMNSQQAHAAVLQGDADLGVTTLEDQADDAFVVSHIWTDNLHVVVAPQHPLARRNPVTLAELGQYPAILPDGRFFTGRIVRDLFTANGIPLLLDPDLSTDFLETLKALVAIGDSWSVLPATMLDTPLLVSLPLENLTLTRQLVAIRHAQRTQSKAARAFLALLQTHHD